VAAGAKATAHMADPTNTAHRRRRGLLIVLSSPSGAGKSTISRMLLESDPHITLSISATTRPMRPGEVEGVDYHFVDEAEFQRMVREGEFAEWAPVFDHHYGSPQAPIKTASRIDVPTSGDDVPAGAVTFGGVAWNQHIGIRGVEISLDGGEWQAAEVAPGPTDDTWVQWFVDWDATVGTHYVAVRAVNKNGDVQIEERAPIAPDGSTGWQRTLIRVT